VDDGATSIDGRAVGTLRQRQRQRTGASVESERHRRGRAVGTRPAQDACNTASLDQQIAASTATK